MVLSSLYFLDLKGSVLISRDYRGDIDSEHADHFFDLLTQQEAANDEAETDTSLPPILTRNGVNYVYVKYNNLYCT